MKRFELLLAVLLIWSPFGPEDRQCCHCSGDGVVDDWWGGFKIDLPCVSCGGDGLVDFDDIMKALNENRLVWGVYSILQPDVEDDIVELNREVEARAWLIKK